MRKLPLADIEAGTGERATGQITGVSGVSPLTRQVQGGKFKSRIERPSTEPLKKSNMEVGSVGSIPKGSSRRKSGSSMADVISTAADLLGQTIISQSDEEYIGVGGEDSLYTVEGQEGVSGEFAIPEESYRFGLASGGFVKKR